MKSIRAKLLRASLLIVGALSVTGAAFLVLSIFVVQQYKGISDNLTAEYRLADAASNLIVAYNARERSLNTDATVAQAQVERAHAEIISLTKFLDGAIKSRESLAAYVGLKNTIDSVVDEVDQGLASIAKEDIESSASHYRAANEKYGFVKDNSVVLFIDELKYADSLQGRINQLYVFSIVIDIVALGAISIGCVLYLLAFSNKIVTPLRKLSTVAQKIAAGDTTTTIGNDLLAGNDEIGSLSQSYKTMIDKLFQNITKLDVSNKEIAQSSHVLTDKNSELEKLNKLMIDRELKMIELKKEIAVLKAPKL